jgi:hypothetical protein
MADALVSGASVRKDVEVQLLSAAPVTLPLISIRGFDSEIATRNQGRFVRQPPSCAGSRVFGADPISAGGGTRGDSSGHTDFMIGGPEVEIDGQDRSGAWVPILINNQFQISG